MRVAYLGCAILFLLAVFPATAGLITNGGFETGDFTGWTVSGGAIDCGVTTAGPHSGTYSACFGNPTTLTFLSQSLATVPGQEYLISFWLAQQPPGQTPLNEAEVIWGGTTVAQGFNISVRPWRFTAIVVTASAPSTQIQFGFDNGPGWFALDDVSVDAIPEPGAGILCGIGLAACMLRKIKLRA
jgi:hypothetical protein